MIDRGRRRRRNEARSETRIDRSGEDSFGAHSGRAHEWADHGPEGACDLCGEILMGALIRICKIDAKLSIARADLS